MALEQDEQIAKKEQMHMWINYMSNVFSQQSMGEPDPKFKQAKQEFEKALLPKGSNVPKPKELKWDFENESG